MNQQRCHPPLPDRDVERIAHSVGRYAVPAATSLDHAQPPTFPLYDDVQIFERPEPKSVVDGLLYEKTFAPICGPTDSGKTFVLTSLGLCIATETRFYGAAIQQPGPAAVILAEGDGLFKRRVAAWKTAHAIPVKRKVGFYTIPATVDFMNHDTSTR